MFRKYKILVVDDEQELREILMEELSFEGAQVFEASGGISALALCEIHSFDIIISDLRMPQGDGEFLTREIRRRFGTYPKILLLTGFADLKIDEAFELGADAYIHKPFHLKKLKEKLIHLVEGSLSQFRRALVIDPGTEEFKLNSNEFTSMEEPILVNGSQVCDERYKNKAVEMRINQNFIQNLSLSNKDSVSSNPLEMKLGRGGFSFLTSLPEKMEGKIVKVIANDGVIWTNCQWSRRCQDMKSSYFQRLGCEILCLDSTFFLSLMRFNKDFFDRIPYIPL